MTSPDRRRHARISLAVDVDVTSGHNFYSGRTRDLSMGGLFIEGNIGLPPGTEVLIELKLGERKFKIRSEVAWILAKGDTIDGFGVQFLEVTDGARRVIEAFMHKREPLAMDVEAADEDPSGPPPLPSA